MSRVCSLAQELRKLKQTMEVEGLSPGPMNEPYHYTNYCSNIASLFQYLIRLPPFTQMFVKFQGLFGSFLITLPFLVG